MTSHKVTIASYYRGALWLPVAVPVAVVIWGFIGNTFFGNDEPFLQMAGVLAVPLPAYVPIALWVRWKIKNRTLAEADLHRTALVTPLIVGLFGGLVTNIAGAGPWGGVVIALLIILFGYVYVGAIELIRALGSRSGWLISDRRTGA
jgi:hypothetical protein